MAVCPGSQANIRPVPYSLLVLTLIPRDRHWFIPCRLLYSQFLRNNLSNLSIWSEGDILYVFTPGYWGLRRLSNIKYFYTSLLSTGPDPTEPDQETASWYIDKVGPKLKLQCVYQCIPPQFMSTLCQNICLPKNLHKHFLLYGTLNLIDFYEKCK